jgi:hypothetical protein
MGRSFSDCILVLEPSCASAAPSPLGFQVGPKFGAAFCNFYSDMVTSRILRKPLKTNSGCTLYSVINGVLSVHKNEAL